MAKGKELKYNRLRTDSNEGVGSMTGGRVLKNVLGGGFLSKDSSFSMLPFLFFVTFLGVVYIAISYYAEKNMRTMNDFKTGLKELRYEYISTHTKLMHISKQSELVKRLESLNIKESTKPPFRISDKKVQ